MKYRTILFSVLLPCVCQFMAVCNAQKLNQSSYSLANAMGQDSIDAKGVFCTHKVPDGYKYWELGGPSFNVAVDGSYVGLYNDRNYWGGNVAFGMFEFADGKEVEIEIASKEPISSFELLPASAVLSAEPVSTGGSVKFKIKKADQKFTLVINGEYQKDVVHLFANSIDKNAPKVEGNGYVRDEQRKLHYFGPGFHRLADLQNGNSALRVSGDWKVYIAPGAVVEGQIDVIEGKGALVSGRGMLMNIQRYLLINMHNSQDSYIEGITIHGHRAQCWNTIVGSSQRCGYRNVNLITTRYASTDGLDVTHCQDCTFDNVFIRASDDAVAIKALADANRKPADCPENRNLTFTRMQLWNDCNNAFGMGAETRASAYVGIKFTNSDILYSFDDPNYHQKLDERSAMNICALHGTYFKDILFENIRVNRCQRLIALGFKPDFWFGTLKGDQSTPGGISNVTFRNITSPNTTGSAISNDILLYGWHKDGTPDKFVENITFDNVVIQGKHINKADSPYIYTNNTPALKLVRNLKFK